VTRERLGGFTRRRHPAHALRPTVLFVIALSLTVAYLAFGVWVSGPWRDQLDSVRRSSGSPGWADRGRPRRQQLDRSTAKRAGEAAKRLGLRYRRVFEVEPGKHRALNAAFESVTTPLVVTVDADTYLQREALTYLVARVTSMPQGQHVCACAGALVPENPDTNVVTRMQQWDYRLGINGVKRMQAAYNCALAAQGAFSAYWTDDRRAVGGWPDAIGLAKFVAGIDYLVPLLDIGFIDRRGPGTAPAPVGLRALSPGDEARLRRSG
jgi:Glycosyl transferase family 2